MAGLSQPAQKSMADGTDDIDFIGRRGRQCVHTDDTAHDVRRSYTRKEYETFIPILDNGPANDYKPGDRYIDEQMSYRDVHALLNSAIGKYRTGLYGISALIEMPRKDLG
jgi:hypothetical protein